MKKIIVLIITCLLITGCDYSDLNSSSIVSTMTIEKKDNSYKTSILTIIPNEQSPYLELTEATNSDLLKSIEDLQKLSTKELYFDHISALIINEEMANNINILDKIIEKFKINKKVHLVLADSNIDKIMNFYKEQSPVHTISSTIKSSKQKNLSYEDLINENNNKIPTFTYTSKPYFRGYTKIKK